MRQLSWGALVMVVGGCGVFQFPSPFLPQSPPPCSALSEFACGSRNDCVLIDEFMGCIGGDCPRRCEVAPPVKPVYTCDMLDRLSCQYSPGCVVEEVSCPAVCTPDGHGGCVPCQGFRCVDKDPALSCSALDLTACGLRSDCGIERRCSRDGTCVPVCVWRPCEALSVVECQVRTDCVREGVGQDLRCVTPKTTWPCSGWTVAECAAHAGCHVGALPCPESCWMDAQGHRQCEPGQCQAPPQQCLEDTTSPPPPPPCTSIDAQACGVRSDCHLEAIACATLCEVDPVTGMTSCVPVPCETVMHCVDGPPVNPCAGLDAQACGASSQCVLEPGICTTECTPTLDGGCVPCPEVCVEASQCRALDAAQCATRTDCVLAPLPCTTECTLTLDGGCVPCPETFVCRDLE